MKSRDVRLILVVALVAGVVVVLSPMLRRGTDTELAGFGQGPLVINLAPPAFAQAARPSFPMNEVGISAYVNVGTTIDLAKARGLFSAPEDVTDSYVIGTIPLVGNGEDMWPHVYIGKDGWLLAYYPNTEPSSKMVQWYGYQRDVISTTTLRDALIALGRNLSLDLSKIDGGITYFHFKYPDATKLIIAVDTVGDTSDEFRYTIPTGIVLYDAAWSHHAEGVGYYGSRSRFDATDVYSAGSGTYSICQAVEPQYLNPNAPHNVVISSNGGWMGLAIVFLYR